MGMIRCSVLLLILFLVSALTLATSLPSFPVAQPNCIDHCGNIAVPFPFGMIESCYGNHSFSVTCNHSFNPSKLFLKNTSIEVTEISLDGQMKIMQPIAQSCYHENGSLVSRTHTFIIDLPIFFTVNSTANKFFVLGCDTYGYISTQRRHSQGYFMSCTAHCSEMDDLPDGSCAGLGCCQTSIPKDSWRMEMGLTSPHNHTEVWEFNDCSYGFLVEETAFRFSPEFLTNVKNVEKLPVVVDWAIGNGTCGQDLFRSSNYACLSTNSECYMPKNGEGYRCRCETGYQGNPYLEEGCQDIDECEDPNLNICSTRCLNTLGAYKCYCPEGYLGDGVGPQGCLPSKLLVLTYVAGIALMIIAVMSSARLVHMKLKRQRLMMVRASFFLQNGGTSLRQKLEEIGKSSFILRAFSSADIAEATVEYDQSKIVGYGGSATVYSGILKDGMRVAIKVFRDVDQTQIKQFMNEVLILCQINHRHVVKLLGCCLETSVPILVYELIDNGTLYEWLHNQERKHQLDWKLRLKIATQIADVLLYLHSAASTLIIHRDVKSTNILLDTSLSAKVSDFGASRLNPINQTQLSTVVQGTIGYVDPEYMQTGQLTDKSDVYSFGVVLVELITGMKPSEGERSLAVHFLAMLKRKRVTEILDKTICDNRNMKQVMKVAKLAKMCLNKKGEHRPCMRYVASELHDLSTGLSLKKTTTQGNGSVTVAAKRDWKFW